MLHPAHPRILKDRDEINDWYLDEDITLTLPNGHVHHIAKGFKFDSHSVPWWARIAFSRYYGQDVYCALIHDYLVAFEHYLPYSRRFVDLQYKLAMQLPEYKVTEARAYWMPMAVRVYNAIKYYWRDYRGEVPKEMTVRVSVKVDVV